VSRAFLARVVEDLRTGSVTEDTTRLASILDDVLRGRTKAADLDKALGLRRGRGRPSGNSTFGKLRLRKGGDLRGLSVDDMTKALDPAVRFIWEHIRCDPMPRGSRERALTLAVARFHVTRRSLERRWAAAQPGIRLVESLKSLSDRLAEIARPFAAISAAKKSQNS
jgi:hypothetical protein